MSPLTLLAAPLVVAGVFLLSGVAKLGDVSDGVRGLREMGVPDVFVRDWVARAHPIAEIIIALGLLVLPTPWRVVAGVAAVGLMAAYTVLVIAAVRRAREVNCNCFGRRSEVVNRRTAVRNLALLALAIVALVDCLVPSAPIVRMFSGLDPLAWSAVLVVTAGVAWLIGRGYAASAPTEPVPALSPILGGHHHEGNGESNGDDEDDEDLERDAIPDHTLTAADGTTITLTELVAQRATVLLFMEPGCGPCGVLMAEVPSWRAIMPQITLTAVRLRPVPGAKGLHEHAGPWQGTGYGTEPGTGEPFPTLEGGYWADPSIIQAFEIQGMTPWAVLLGADGLIAGGPVASYPHVRAFLVEILAHLAGLA